MQQPVRFGPSTRSGTFLARWGRLLALLALLLTGSTSAWAQLTGTKTIGTDYPTVAAAITALNASGVGSGGVTFNVPAGYVETFGSPTAGRITLNSTSANPSTGTNPVVFQKSGTGANPQITAGVGTTTALDAIISLVGTDYVTFDGIDVTEAAANTTATTQAEFGYALFRATATDGCQNNIIRNCVVTLNKTNVNTIGITGQTNTAAATTTVTATSTAGGNSNNIVLANVVTNALIGINFAASSSTTAANYDAGNLIGITALGFAAGNTVGNFGGTASGWGIGGSYQAGLKISNNTINSTRNYTNASTFTSVAASTVTSTLRGVYGNTGTSANVDISNNNITLASGATTSQLSGIENSIGSTAASNTANLTNNTVQMAYNTATTAAIYGVFNSASAATVNLTGNTVQNLSATAATSATFYGIYNTGAGTTMNMNTNTVSGNVLGSSSTATTSVFYGVYNSAAATTLNANSNVVQNNTHYTTSGAMALVYGAGSPTNFNVGSNQLTGNTKNGATASGVLYGIYVTTSIVSATNNVVSNNTITSGGTSASSLYGYYSFSSATSETLTGNTFSNLTINGTGTSTSHQIGGVRSYTTASDVLTIGQNTILTLAITAGSGPAYGVYITLGSGTISRNKIADLSAVGTAATAYGINIAGGTTFTAANNLVGDLRTPASTSLVAVSGLYAAGATTFNAYFNTVYLNATGGATFGTSGIYLNSTSTTLDSRNNIVVNTSTAAGTGGYTAAFRRVSGTTGTVPANYATTSNNNLFYAGTPSATNLIYVEGTTTATNPQSTLAAYKSFMGNRDQSAVTENPPFLSTTGTDASFLHINPAVATQVESGGVAVSGITTDFDGDSRNSIPDIGADEGTFTPSDLSPPSITYTPLANTSSTGSRTLTVNITDPSGVAGGANAPRLYYRVGSSGPYSFVTATSTSVTGLNNGTYTFTIPGAAAGSTVQYYVAAQDANGNSGTNPGGGSGTPPGSTPPTTPNSYQVLQSLAGTYYVGTGTGCGTPTYATLTAAVADYNAKGLAGAVTFQLVDNAYTGETYPITINANLDASSTNTLTIKPCPTASPVFTGSNAGPLLVINGTSYITLDGSNAGTTSQNWTLNNTNASTSASLVQLTTNAGGTAPTYNTVRNLVLTGAASATTFTTAYGIRMANASPATTGASNNTFANNAITKVQTGISVVGLSSAVRDANNSITGNQVGSATTAAGFGGTAAVGISLSNQNTLTVTGNVVRNPVIVAAGANATSGTALISATTLIGIDLTSNITTATVANNTVRDLLTSGSSTYSSPAAGIRVGTAVTSATLNANLVTNVKTSATNGYGAYGIEVYTATASVGDVLSNNMVSDINGTNYTIFGGSSSAGIFLVGTTSGSAQSGITVVYNSVNIYGTSTYSSAVYTAALAVEAGVTGLTVRNNVLSNSNVGSTSGSLPYSLYSTAPASSYTAINNNDYYSSGSQAPASNVQVAIGGTTYTTLAAVQGATGQDAASISTAPGFTAPNDLHTTNTNLRVGAPIAGITTDFDGDTRDATTPTIGADEVIGISNDAGVVAITQPTAPFAAGPQTVTVQVKNFGVATLNSVTVNWTVNGVAQAPQNFTGLNLAPGATSGNLSLGSYNFAAGSTYTIVATTSAPNGGTDGNTANDSFTRTVAPGLIGTYTVGAGQQFTTLTNAVNALNAGGVLGAVTFSLTDASYSTSETFPIIINTIAGGSSTNTLTIKPASGVSPTISGSVATGAVLKLSGADYVTIDGSNAGTTSRDLTITNTSATGNGNAVLWIAAASASDGATNNVVKNTNITGNSSAGNPQFTVFVGGSGTTPTTSTPAANSNNTIQNNVITKGYYGLFMFGVSTTVLDQSNVVTGNQIGQSATGTGFGQEGMRAVYQQGLNVTGNEIQNVTNSTNTANLYALYLLDTKGTVVSHNSVHNISYTGTTTYKVWAIESATTNFNTAGNASANRFDNNFVYAINSTATSSTWNTVGINANGGYGDQYYFNTVYLSGQLSAAGGTAGSAAFANGNPSVTTTSTNIDVRDNIFSIIGGTGGTTSTALYAHYEYGASVTGSTLNYNDLYVTVGSTGSAQIGYLNSTSSATLAAWQTATGMEANSISVDPAYLSATNPHVSNAALKAGTPISGITTDYDNETRDATAPTIGADEFVPPSNDAGVVAITQPTSPFAAGSQTVAVQVKNFAIATLNSVTVNWTVNGVAQTPQTFTGLNLAPGATSGDLSLGSYNFVAGTSYTIVATTSAPNGGTDGNTGNDSFTRTVTPALCGNYNVGAGQTFATLDAAVTALNAGGASCAVTFTLTDATYAATTGITINAYAGNNSTNTLTIKPASGVSPTISGSVAGPLLVLNGVSYVTLDGSNAGTTSQNLTLNNTSTGASAALVQLTSNTGGTTASNNTVKNLVLTGAASTTTFTTAYGVQLVTAANATAGATGNTIQNNAITKVQTGITVAGLSTTVRNSGTVINGNQVGSPTTAAGFGGATAKGIVASNENTLTVTGNVVRNPVIVAAGATSTGATALISVATFVGIDLLSNIGTATVSNNVVRDLLTSGSSGATSPLAGIRLGSSGTAATGSVTGVTANANLVTNVKTTATGGYGAYGIDVNTGTASANDLVSNNMVSDINGSSNYSAFTNSSTAGIYLYGTQSGISVVYNSVNIYGASTYSVAVLTAALAVETGSTGLTVQNNVLSNSNVGSTSGSLPYSLYSNAPASAYTTINNNDYYSSGSQAPASGVQVAIGGTAYTTLASVQTATGQDAASLSVAPAFTAPNDLHNTNPALKAGAPIAGITTDFDGDLRDATTPTIGADEYVPITNDAGVVAITQPTAPFAAGPQTVSVQVKNFGVSTLNSVTVNWTVNGVAQAPQTFTGLNLAPGATSGDLSLGSYNFSTGGPTFTIVATTSNPNGAADGNTANDSFTRTVAPGLIGTYTVGVGQQFATLTNAVNTLNVAGVLGAVTFSLTDASYTTSETFPISINAVIGGSSTNTVTIKPASGVTASVSGSSGSAILKLNGADYITVDGSNATNGTSRDLSLTNTSTGTSALVVWLASVSASDGATYNTIKNLNLTGGSNSASQSAIGVLGSSLTTKGYANSNNTLQNNTAIRVTVGINAQSIFGSAYQNLVIVDNVLGSASNTAADNLTTGIFLAGTPSAQVTHNTVQNLGSGAAANVVGISLLRGTTGALVNRNTVRGVRYTGTGGYGARGISVAPGASATGIIIRNNAVSAVTADGDGSTGPTYQIMGIGIFTGSSYSVYNNSVQLSGDRVSNSYTGQISAAMWVDSSATSLDVRNNVLSNVQTTSNTSSPGTNYGLYATVAASAFSALDYNLYDLRSGATFRTQAVSPQFLGHLGTTDYATLAAWKTATGQSRSSMLTSGLNTPGFTSATDLTPNAADPGSYSLNGTGVQISSVTTDLNGSATRPTTVAAGAPDLGAYEVTPTATPNPLDVTGTPGVGNTQTFSFNSRPVATITYGPAGTPPTNVVGRYYPGVNPPGPFASGAKYANAYFNFQDANGSGNGYTYTPTLTYDPALLGTIASETAQQVSLRNADNSGYDTYPSTVNTTNRTVASNLQLSRLGVLALSDAAAPLPVTLVKFEAVRQGTDALLSWTTASELDNKGFEVQVSTDGQKYHTLGFVAGAGSSNSTRNYSFVDREAGKAGLRYYRLNQVDLSGKSAYSSVRTLTFEVAELLVQAAPNPFASRLTLTLSLPGASTSRLLLTDALGRQVLHQELGTLPAGTTEAEVAGISQLPAGVYLLRVTVGSETRTLKVVRD